jgi:hypothetical protein
MKKVVPLFYSNQKKCYEIWSSYDASLELTGWREQYQVPIVIDELFTDYIGSKKKLC